MNVFGPDLFLPRDVEFEPKGTAPGPKWGLAGLFAGLNVRLLGSCFVQHERPNDKETKRHFAEGSVLPSHLKLSCVCLMFTFKLFILSSKMVIKLNFVRRNVVKHSLYHSISLLLSNNIKNTRPELGLSRLTMARKGTPLRNRDPGLTRLMDPEKCVISGWKLISICM